MGIGTSVFLLVLGAILTFAVHVPVDGVNVQALGVILMFIGAIGAIISLAFWNSWGGWGNGGWGPSRGTVYRRERVVVDPGVPVARAYPVAAAPVAPVVGAAVPVAGAGVPVAGAGVPVAGAGVPVAGAGVPVAGAGVPVAGAGVPVAGAPVAPVVPVVGAPARVVRRPVEVRHSTTVYEDDF